MTAAAKRKRERKRDAHESPALSPCSSTSDDVFSTDIVENALPRGLSEPREGEVSVRRAWKVRGQRLLPPFSVAHSVAASAGRCLNFRADLILSST